MDNLIDYLAITIDCVELPSFTAEDVSKELDFCTTQWYPAESAAKFYTDMVADYNMNMMNVPEPPVKQEPRQPRKIKHSRKPLRRVKSNDRTVSDSEVEAFRVAFKTHRVRLGLTQAEAAKAISNVTNRRTSQTSLCRFENNQLHPNNMANLYPFFKQWVSVTSSQ